VAVAEEPPMQRPGFWQLHMQMATIPESPMNGETTWRMCRDDAYNLRERESAKKSDVACSVNKWQRTAEGFAVTKTCKIAGSVVSTRGTVREDASGILHTEMHISYAPAVNGVKEFTVVSDQKLLGSCPEGVKGGDRVDADGSVTHLGS
jgi:hypothetical protein